MDEETGLYYYGARYLDPKTSRWLSTDPALGEYIPGAPVNEEARKHNQNLPGMGGVFNTVNLHLYHYAGNNPVKYIDPDGRADCGILDGEGNYTIKAIKENTSIEVQRNDEKGIDDNDVARIKIGTVVVGTYQVQSEKNYKTKNQEKSDRWKDDTSVDATTLPDGDNYKATLVSETPSYYKPLVITSDTAQINGKKTRGLTASQGYLFIVSLKN